MAQLDFGKLREQKLPPPFTPPDFEVAVPAPKLWYQSGSPMRIAFTEHQGYKLEGEVWELKRSIEEARDRSREMAEVWMLPEDRANAPMGFNVFTLGKASAQEKDQTGKIELVHWNQEKK